MLDAKAGRFAHEVGERARQLAVGMVDGRVLPTAEAAAARVALIDDVARELPTVSPRDALAALDALARHGLLDLEPQRAVLEAERVRRFPPPPAATWPEFDELRALAKNEPDTCELGPPLRTGDIAPAMLERGVLVPDELLALYAAFDGVTLRDRTTGALALQIVAAEELYPCPLRGAKHAAVIMTETARRGMVMTTTTRFLVDGAPGRWRLGYAIDDEPQGEQALDVPALLRVGMRRARTGPPPGLPILPPLATDLTWEEWQPRSEEAWVDALVVVGERERARAVCRERAAWFADDEDSSMRAGDFGEATRAERAKDWWTARLRELE